MSGEKGEDLNESVIALDVSKGKSTMAIYDGYNGANINNHIRSSKGPADTI